jgi:hypothetical protein
MKLIAPPYNNKKSIIGYQANDDYNDILELIKDINSFLDDKSNYWLNEMVIYLDLEELENE